MKQTRQLRQISYFVNFYVSCSALWRKLRNPRLCSDFWKLRPLLSVTWFMKSSFVTRPKGSQAKNFNHLRSRSHGNELTNFNNTHRRGQICRGGFYFYFHWHIFIIRININIGNLKEISHHHKLSLGIMNRLCSHRTTKKLL